MTILLDQLNEIHKKELGHIRTFARLPLANNRVYEVSGKVWTWRMDEVLGTFDFLPVTLKLAPLYYANSMSNYINNIHYLNGGRAYGYLVLIMHPDKIIANVIGAKMAVIVNMPTYDYNTHTTPIATMTAQTELLTLIKDSKAYILSGTSKVYV